MSLLQQSHSELHRLHKPTLRLSSKNKATKSGIARGSQRSRCTREILREPLNHQQGKLVRKGAWEFQGATRALPNVVVVKRRRRLMMAFQLSQGLCRETDAGCWAAGTHARVIANARTERRPLATIPPKPPSSAAAIENILE
jgi:hypothetical protein